MQLSNDGYNLLVRDEGIRYKAYQDTRGVWTIGIGFTHYPNGKAVKPGDTITPAQCKVSFDSESKSYDNFIPKPYTSINLDEYTKLYMMWDKPKEIIARRTRDCKWFTDKPSDQTLYDSLFLMNWNTGRLKSSSLGRYCLQ